METREVFGKRITRFELARVVGARALQLALGAPPLVDVNNIGILDPVAIAIAELLEGALPMSVRRRTSDGRYELVPVRELLTDGVKRYLRSLLESWRASSRT
ncbi:MAG: DNA-directed RNA polymerase subunit K [Desulfurococcaceae archaeon]